MIFPYILLMMLLIISTLGENCDVISCSNVFDHVCGMAETEDGTQVIMKYQNICFMWKMACELESIVVIKRVAEELCGTKKTKNIKTILMQMKATKDEDYRVESRRVNDFTIVGAHQACNHSCPTYCTDSYEPACAQIWKRNMLSYTYRPMINHCHIDLFSCAAGLNVTIQPLGKCYKNPSGLLFMQQIAAMKSLRLLDEDPLNEHFNAPSRSRRKTNVVHQDHEAAK